MEEIIMEKEEKLFAWFLRLRKTMEVDDLVFIFTEKKAKAFEALRLKFFAGVNLNHVGAQ